MSRELLASQKNHSGIVLDPRTKLAVLTTIAVFILGGSYEGVMQYYIIVLAAIPLLILLSAGKWKGAVLYLLIFGGSLCLELFGLSYLTGVANFIAVAIVGLFLRFTPGIVMGYFVVTTTTVSEFVAAMERLHLPADHDPNVGHVPLFPDGGGRMERHWGCHADARRPLWRWKGRLYSGIPHGSHDDLLRQDWRRVECGGTDPRSGRTGQADQHL